MIDEKNYQAALEKLKLALPKIKSDEDIKKIVESKDVVFNRFRPVFSPENIQKLGEEDFKPFLLFENNLHWTGLHRQGTKICADMEKLRQDLLYLLDEKKPIADRVNRIIGNASGMGKATTTAVLLIAYPEKYGAWNTTSEEGLKKFNLWPDFERGTKSGKKYEMINEILIRLASDLEVDLWTLDAFWWLFRDVDVFENEDLENILNLGVTIVPENQRFAKEIHLHKFLLENWERTSLGNEWQIYSEDGDEIAGYEYLCGTTGRIDLLARHKTKNDWLVIELKKGESSDSTVGQILRYIGWIKENMANSEEKVYGIIIANKIDDRLKYALSVLPFIDAMCYEIDFRLTPYKSTSKNFI
ncbi:endonuclease NucS domain-containing protein [Methanosarcina sp.]|uniref:endonuclease NucS domain-containing protein n=1 Tax=Methanosarcina sp. TaxID=2213 RepID=UPI002C25E3E7|nr:endonuclease NucS domain-containing protein [Methanosarcina sp.]HOW14997.1 endonuclease NucS [Methanosarcina sp.]